MGDVVDAQADSWDYDGTSFISSGYLISRRAVSEKDEGSSKLNLTKVLLLK